VSVRLFVSPNLLNLINIKFKFIIIFSLFNICVLCTGTKNAEL
jgi:hypothetical protein